VLLNPVWLFCKAPVPAAKLYPPVAEELKFVVEPIEMFEGTFPLPVLKNKPLIVPFEPDVEIEPVTPNDPVISADPVKGNATPPPPLTVIGNVVPLPLVNVIVFEDTDAVTIAFGVNEAVEAKLELTAFKTYEAVEAFEAVPKSEPVNDVAVKDPEMFTVFKAKSPFISGVPEPEAMYNLLLSFVDVEGPAANPIAILFEEFPEKKDPAFCPKAILLDPPDEEIKVLSPIAVLLFP
jgi:hypothetical protein